MALAPHEDLSIPKGMIRHPRAEGFTESVGEPQGQIADFRKRHRGVSLHVREFENLYRIHWDKRDPDSDPFRHIVEDAPHWLIIGGIAILAIGGFIYAVLKSGNKESEEVI